MHRARASVPPEAIRIEDEVWQEAFRETTRPRARAHLRSLDGVRPTTRPAAGPVGARSTTHPAAVTPAPRRPPTPRAVPESAPPSASRDGMPVRSRDGIPVRRTVTITGRGAERNLPWSTGESRRRPARLPHERAGFRPDRVAMWAVFLGILLLLVAAASSHV